MVSITIVAFSLPKETFDCFGMRKCCFGLFGDGENDDDGEMMAKVVVIKLVLLLFWANSEMLLQELI